MKRTADTSKNDRARILRAQLDLLDDNADDPVSAQAAAHQRAEIYREVIELYDPWLRHMSRIYSSVHRDLFDDLKQAASEAALRAFARWQPERSSFTHWASKEVCKALIAEFMPSESPALRRWDYEAMRKVRTYRAAHPDASDDAVCDAVGITGGLLARIDVRTNLSADLSEYEHLTSSDPTGDVVDGLAQAAALERVTSVLSACDPKVAEVMTMVYIAELSQKEIAALLGVHRETIRRRHNAGVELLRSDTELAALVAD